MDGQLRKVKNPGVFLDKSQKIFFIGIGEVFPDPQIDFLVVDMVQVGHIQRNEDGQNQEEKTKTAVPPH